MHHAATVYLLILVNFIYYFYLAFLLSSNCMCYIHKVTMNYTNKPTPIIIHHINIVPVMLKCKNMIFSIIIAPLSQ